MRTLLLIIFVTAPIVWQNSPVQAKNCEAALPAANEKLLSKYLAILNEPGGAYFTPPNEWMFTDPDILPKTVRMMAIGKGKNPYPPSINLTEEEYRGTLGNYLKIVKEINESQGFVWKNLGTIDTQIGKGSLSQVDTETSWGPVRMMHVILPKNDKIYILTASALKEEFPNFYDQFFAAMKSFNINPKNNTLNNQE